MKQLKETLWEYIRAGFSGIWIQTHETSEALLEISELSQQRDLQLWTWNLESGLKTVRGEAAPGSADDPLTAVRCLGTTNSSSSNMLLVLENFHRFIDSTEIAQALVVQLLLGKQLGRHIIILAPIVKLPAELERLIVTVEHPLPSRDQLWQIVQSLVEDADAIENSKREKVLDASAGLTRGEAESAFSLSLVRQGQLNEEEIWQLKSRWLKKSGLLQLHKAQYGFDALGGLENLKRFCLASLTRRTAGENCVAKPRGIMLLGVPGTGKSAFAKALGKEADRPVLTLDVGQLMGSLVGQSEANIRSALRTADAMAPCILFIDEVEKGLSGASSGSAGDSGVASRLFGTLLTWLNDHTTDVYVVVTCNNIQHLPPEFSRAERFDAILFLDLPGEAEKQAIWSLYTQEFQLAQQPHPCDDRWTGAEIKACCRLASLLGVSLQQAASYIVPVGVTAAETVESLRCWASGRCIDASSPGVYKYARSANSSAASKVGSTANTRPKRGISLRPSDN